MEVKYNDTEQYTKYYFDNYELIEQNGVAVEKIFYLSSPTGVIGFNRIKTSPTEDNIYYTLKDYLGSIVVVTNEAGTIKLEEYSYNAWGRRRNAVDWTYNGHTAPTYTTLGYTPDGHFHQLYHKLYKNMKKNIMKYLRIYPLFIFMLACGAGGLNDKTKELSGGYIARVDGSISYILPDNIFNEGIYPNVIDFAFNEDFILVYQMPLKEKFVTVLAQDIRMRYNVLTNVQDTSELSKDDYELMKTSLLANSSFYRMLTKELSPNNTAEDIERSEDIAKDVIINSEYYRSILEKDTCFWIINHLDKRKYGPLTQLELFSKANELNVPEKLQQEFKGCIE